MLYLTQHEVTKKKPDKRLEADMFAPKPRNGLQRHCVSPSALGGATGR